MQACEVSILVTGLALVFLSWTFESFNMLRITTFRTPTDACMSLLGIKISLVWWILLLVYLSLVTLWLWLEGFPLAFAWWNICSLVPHQIDLSCLLVTWYLLDVSHSCLGCFHLLSKLPHFACWELYKINTPVIDGLGHKLFIFQEKPKDVMVQDICSLLWISSKTYLSLYSILPFIHWSITLVKAFKQLNLACTSLTCGLQNSSYQDQIVS